MPEELLTALNTAVFRGFLERPPCEVCEGRGCERPFGIDSDGLPVSSHQFACVWWHKCARNWDFLCEYGMELLTLDEVLRWEYERGSHQARLLPAGASRLFREYTRIRDMPIELARAKGLKQGKNAD